MKGWWTKHQEFTLAKGDPKIINYLISELQLEGIVSFDESNNLITTTIQHSKQIRLSDLLILNKQHKVIAFTLRQYLSVIIQLFQLIKRMKMLQIQHGNLSLENIILDLNHSQNKLDNKATEIIFQIKLINFAAFYNSQMQDDFQMAIKIYSQIAEYYPKHKELNIQKSIVIQQDDQFIEQIQQQINVISQSPKKNMQEYSWDSNYFPTFYQKYISKVSIPSSLNQIKDLIIQLHQYYLIVNHYPELIQSNKIKDWFKIYNPYLEEPQNLLKACSYLQNLFEKIPEINPVKLQNIKFLVSNLSFDSGMNAFLINIQDQMTYYLKKKGYLQNINKFTQIVQNVDEINQFAKNIFIRIIASYSNIWNLKLPSEILKPYIKSQIILKRMVMLEIINFEIKNPYNIQYNHITQSSQYLSYISASKNNLIILLKNIEKIGQKYSEPLINQINLKFSTQLKEQYKLNVQFLNQIMVQSWLNWVDQYIFDKKFSNLEQLKTINEVIFIEFVKNQGYQIITKELERQIAFVVDGIFLKLII